MYPYFTLWWVPVYIFGLTLTICFFLFLWMLKRLCSRFWINSTFFFNRTMWYFFSVVIFSRIFFITSRWNEFKFIDHPNDFFLMTNYNLSLMWAIFWFFLVLFISIISKWLRAWKYVDATVISLLFTISFGFIWAFLGGQVYWKPTVLWKWILYNTAISNVPYQVEVFPLPIVYAAIFFVLFLASYMIAMFTNIRWIVWYCSLVIFSSVVLFFEKYSWQTDMFFNKIWLNLSQISAIWLIILSIIWIIRLYKAPNIQTEII